LRSPSSSTVASTRSWPTPGVAAALAQPENVNVGEIVVRSAAQP